jgi:hypothetical protein
MGLVKLFEMRGSDEFHMSMKVSKTSSVSRYSEKTREVMANAIKREGIDQLWADWKAARHRDARDYLTNGRTNVTQQSLAPAEAQA